MTEFWESERTANSSLPPLEEIGFDRITNIYKRRVEQDPETGKDLTIEEKARLKNIFPHFSHTGFRYCNASSRISLEEVLAEEKRYKKETK